MPYFEIAVAKVHTGQRLFTYSYDEALEPGSIVGIPYGRQKAFGVVVVNVKKPTFRTRNIDTVLPYRLPNQQLILMQWMFDFYPEDFGDIVQLFLPDTFLKRPKVLEAPKHHSDTTALPIPTPEQAVGINAIRDGTSRLLLHGDTGSGKTRVYIEAIRRAIESSRSVLILTPEIGLTAQLVTTLTQYIAAPIILSHSRMTPSQRRTVWLQAMSADQAMVYVGPRSALFLPIKYLGLIVIDESHDDSYKQLQAPRYRTIDVASKLASVCDANLIQATATPNVQDYYIAAARGYTIIRMVQKAAGSAQGEIKYIDRSDRSLFTHSPHIADDIIDKTKQAIASGQQALFYLNRRGSARMITCQTCGWRPMCSTCHIPLIYHHDHYSLQCHSCGRTFSVPVVCEECKSSDIVYKGIGTKALVQHVATLFPHSRIERFDADVEPGSQLDQRIAGLQRGEADIIVGTQTITKGLDLPLLSVACAVQADDGLQFPDYRAEEITFQQLYQMIGRTVRGHVQGTAFIQTRQPHIALFEALLKQQWDIFYHSELAKRRTFRYPPFCYLALCSLTLKRATSVEHAAYDTAAKLRSIRGVEVIGPGPSYYVQTARGYTWHIVLKSHSRQALVNVRSALDDRWTIDIDPPSLL